MKIKFILTLFLFEAILVFAQDNSSLQKAIEKAEYFKDYFKAECAEDKITDNYGNGFDALYGTRNMRPVLHGFVYRGGANNFYHKKNKRKNSNPLPADGLENLCKQGFSAAVYLYSKNFSTAKNLTIVGSDTLEYINNTLPDRKSKRQLAEMVYTLLQNPNRGPVYLHCWNGWHQSGLASVIILRQFCGIGKDEALSYWRRNAAGDLSDYKHVIKQIKNFTPFEEFFIQPELRKAICPCFRK